MPGSDGVAEEKRKSPAANCGGAFFAWSGLSRRERSTPWQWVASG